MGRDIYVDYTYISPQLKMYDQFDLNQVCFFLL